MPYQVSQLRKVNITSYTLSMTEGGSQPWLVRTDDGEQYVIKFRGAAQGPKVLIAELIGGEIARALGLKMPELVFARLGKSFGVTESNPELQDQFKASQGLNIGLRYLPGANMFDPTITKISPELASRIVWLDCLITNTDRTVQNPNMLIWNKELWLIDHGAALFFHHRWVKPAKEEALRQFPTVKDHVLLKEAQLLKEADTECRDVLTKQVIGDIVYQIPDDWLIIEPPFHSFDDYRQAYEEFLLTRIANSSIFVKEAAHARSKAI